jgi:hypothetical protein
MKWGIGYMNILVRRNRSFGYLETAGPELETTLDK